MGIYNNGRPGMCRKTGQTEEGAVKSIGNCFRECADRVFPGHPNYQGVFQVVGPVLAANNYYTFILFAFLEIPFSGRIFVGPTRLTLNKRWIV